jgi:hypothetical protein
MRLRYQAAFEFETSATTYWTVSDEVFLRLYPTAAVKTFEQNRFFTGVGIRLDEKLLWRLEIGYMLQDIRRSAETAHGSERVNHIIRAIILSDVPLRR